MASSSSCSIDNSSSDSEAELKTPKKKRYKRSLYHGVNRKVATHYNVTPEKTISTLNNGNLQHSLDVSPSRISTSSLSDDSDTRSSSDTSDTSCTSSSEDEPLEYEETAEPEDKPLYEGSRHTVQSASTAIMLYVMKHSVVKEGFSDLLLLISSLLPETARFTTSVYKIKENLKSTIGYQEAIIHHYCEVCQMLCEGENSCDNADCRRNNTKTLVFHDLRIEEQLKTMFQDDVFLNLVTRQIEPSDGILHDIVDAEVYKNTVLPVQNGADLNLTLTMNTDGVFLFSSSKKGSLWPVYIAINELPIKLRFSRKYLMLCYLHCQVEKPNMVTYLWPMVQTLQKLHTTGIEVSTSLGKIHMKAHLLAASLDLPARAMVAHTKQFNGKHACNVCLDEGECAPGNPMHRFYPYSDGSMKRTHISMLHDAEEATRTGSAVHGIKGASALVALEYVDLTKIFPVDWMHCVLLGVTKALMRFWFDSKNKDKPFFIGNKTSLLDKRLLNIKIPDFVSRRQRTLQDHKHWKASECREWLIHFSMPVLSGILSPTPYVHYLLLVTAMAILTTDGISCRDIDLAENLLNGFTETYPRIYGKSAQTMNVHLLRHIAGFCRQHGPLFTHSCFGFESMNSYLKKMVHGTRHINSQVCFAVGMSKQMSSLVRKFSGDGVDSTIRALTKCLSAKFLQEENDHLPTDESHSLGRTKEMLPAHPDFGQLPEAMQASQPRVFMRLQKGNSVYFCKEYQQTKTRNSYTVCFRNGDVNSYGFILCFVQVNGANHAVVEMCETEKFCLTDAVKGSVTDAGLTGYLQYSLCSHVVRVLSHERKVIVPVNNLLHKCVLMNITPVLTFISNPPNLVEHG